MTITDEYYEVLKAAVPGWMVKEKMAQFEKMYERILENGADRKSAFNAVEIGVWYGMSAIAQGLIIKKLQVPCKLYAIDAWTAEACAEGTQDDANREWWNNQDYDQAFDFFIKSIKEFGLEDIITVIKSKSETCMKLIPEQIDILHIDGNHSEEKAVLDVELYMPRVKQGAWIMMDDATWPHTQMAVGILNVECELIYEFDEGGQSFNLYVR